MIDYEVTIRYATEDEWDKVPPLHRDEGEEYVEDAKGRNKSRFEKIPLGERIVLFAEYEGQVIGSVQIQLVRKDTGLADGKTTALLDDLVVDPDFRGQGIGKKLLASAEQVLREKGFSKTTLAVRRDENHSALCQFYDKRGYQFFFEKQDGSASVFKKEL